MPESLVIQGVFALDTRQNPSIRPLETIGMLGKRMAPQYSFLSDNMP